MIKMHRESDVAATWDLTHEQMRLLRRRHGWAHVRLSRQDIRYTDDQLALIVAQMTRASQAESVGLSGQTTRSRARNRTP